MAKHVLIIDGHPDADEDRFSHALAKSYADGLREQGGEARTIRLADLQIPLLRSAAEFAAPPTESAIVNARAEVLWAEHLVLIFPLWLGSAPALVRAFFEQLARGGFAAEIGKAGWRPALRGKSARVIVTMGMPVFIYRTIFGGHGLRSWKQSVLGFAGISPIRMTLFGGIEAAGARVNNKRLNAVRALGRRAQ